MASIMRLLIDNGTDFNTDFISYVDTGSVWVEAHICVDIGGAFQQIPNWKTAAKRPTSAMTSNSSPSPFVAMASSEYSSSYPAWKAFNNDNSDAYGWASDNNDPAPWIQLKIDIPLKNIGMVIKNRTRSSLVNGPIAGKIYGTDDGSAPADANNLLGTFNGLPGATSTAITTLNIAAKTSMYYNNAFQYIRIVFTDWNNKGSGSNQYCAIGEIEIYGKYAN